MHRLALLAAALGLGAAAPASALTSFIDPFNTPQAAEVVTSAVPATAGSTTTAPFAIGGERDIWVQKTAGGEGERVRTRVNPNGETLLRQTIDDANGRTRVTWDGDDGDAATVDYAGLGGLDFLIYTTLDLMVTFSDVGGPINFTFWDASDLTGQTYARTTFTVPGSVPAGSSLLLTRNFTMADFSVFGTGATLTSILGNVGAIQMEIDATAVAQEGWDSRYDYVAVTGPDAAVPLPAPILLSIAGLAALGGLGLRRRAA